VTLTNLSLTDQFDSLIFPTNPLITMTNQLSYTHHFSLLTGEQLAIGENGK
jgi:hypothetical protein